jgi:hypothetical protein
LSSRLPNGREHTTTEHTVGRSGKSKRKPFNSNVADYLLGQLQTGTATAIALALHGEHTPEVRGHHPNTDAPPNEQAGTAIPEQPLVARVIGSLLDK